MLLNFILPRMGMLAQWWSLAQEVLGLIASTALATNPFPSKLL